MEPTTVIAKISLSIANEITKKILNYSIENFDSFKNKYAASKLNGKIKEELSHIVKVKTLWGKGKTINIDDVYYPAKLSRKDLNEIFISASNNSDCKDISIQEIFSGDNTVIQGIVGQGKSFFLRHLAETSFETCQKVPVFIELMRISEKNSILNEIDKSLERLGIILNKNHSPQKKYKILENFNIFLDGFDEIDSKNVMTAINDIDELSRLNKTKIIITSRPNSQITNLPSFKILSIKRLRSSDYDGFIENLKDIEYDTQETLKKKLKEISPDLKGVTSTPLMLTLFVMVYLSETSIPENISEFYEKLFTTVFSRHDNLKPGFKRERACNISESKLLEFFEAFSFISKRNGYERSLNTKQFIEVFNKTKEITRIEIKDENHFKSDIANGTNLMLDDGFDFISYTHKSLQEYYSSTFIRKLDDSLAEKFYTSAQEDYTEWLEVINYLTEIDKVRFSKYFAIPILEKVISDIPESTNYTALGKKLLKFIENYSDDWRLLFESTDGLNINSFMVIGGSSNRFKINGFRFFSLNHLEMPIIEYLSPRDDLFENTAQGFIKLPKRKLEQKPSYLTLEDYNKKINLKLSPSTETGNIECDLSVIISHIAEDKLNGIIGYIRSSLQIELGKYKKIVEIEQGKRELFEF